MIPCLADGHDSVGREVIFRHGEVEWRRAFADASGGVVVRPMAWAEIAAILAAVLARGDTQGDAAQMGADAERDQPILLAGLGPLRERLRVAQLIDRDRIGLGD